MADSARGSGDLRTFIAAELSVPVREVITELIAKLSPCWPQGKVRWSKPENLHLTLRFLGATPQPQISPVSDALQVLCSKRRPISLILKGLGAFPDIRRPNVIWVGLQQETAALIDLQRQIESTVYDLGWTAERRPFRPHLTIGRLRQTTRSQDTSWVDTEVPEISYSVNTVSLIESQLAPRGAIYQTLYQAQLE